MIVEEHPLSLRIHVNEAAVFTCRARCEKGCSNIYWVINGNSTYNEQQRSRFQQMGFTFSYGKESRNSSLYNAMLTVNATKAVNNTNVYCVFENYDGTNHSLTATLQITAGKKNRQYYGMIIKILI